MGNFGTLIFGPGILLGFAGSTRDFLGLDLIFLGLAPFDHLCHLKSLQAPGLEIKAKLISKVCS